MGEDGSWPGEPADWYGQGQLGHGFLFQGLHQDAFQPAHIDEVQPLFLRFFLDFGIGWSPGVWATLELLG